MTVICVPPSPTVRHGNQTTTTVKPVTHTVLSLKKKVRFNDRVRVRRRTQIPFTPEEFKAIWFSGDELYDRRRKDKKLRYAIARQPEIFGAENLLVVGLFNEDQRRQRCRRAMASRQAVLSQQQQEALDSMDVDAGSDSDDSSSALTSSTPTSGCYALHSEASSAEAYVRALQHAAHVQNMDNDDESSEAGMSQELSVSSETVATQEDLPKVEIPQPIGVCMAA